MSRPTIDSPYVDLSNPAVKRRLLGVIGRYTGLYSIVVKPCRVTRSNQANAFYWGVAIHELRGFLSDQGVTTTAEECHDLLKRRFLTIDIVNPETGEVIGQTCRSTASLDVTEFAHYLDRCVHWMSESLGIVLPEPTHPPRNSPPPTQARHSHTRRHP